MKLIVWGALLAVTLLAGPAAAQSCRPPPEGAKTKNLAIRRPAFQSSVHPRGILGSAHKAVDGNCNGDWSHGSCTRTKQEAQPWWYVDLGQAYNISVVVVKNHENCCGELTGRIEIHVGDSLENHGRSNPLCGLILNTKLGSISTIYCNGKQGRYVSVHLPGYKRLVLCEVEVFGI